MKEPKFYILFFDYRGNAHAQEDAVKFITERLRLFYLKNKIIPLGENTFLVKEETEHSTEIFIQSAKDDLSTELSNGLSEINHFLVPVKLDDISEYIKHLSKQIEILKQTK